jgi:hypothetical protein
VALLNYTTKVDAAKTVGEIAASLVKAGASAIQHEYENGRPTGASRSLSTSRR